MKVNSVGVQKKAIRSDLARKPFEEKVAILIRLQTMAREMAQASGRAFTGVVWGQSPR